MISDEQLRIRIERVKKELEAIKMCKNIREISEMTGIPTSTIQRDLNNKKLIVSLTDEELFEHLKEWLKIAKQFGTVNGGKNSQELHGYEKDSDGHFKGSRK